MSKNLVQKTCAVCGSAFEVIKSREHRATTCSKECKYAQSKARYQDQRVALVCKACGKEFHVPKCHADRRTFCSNECAEPARHLNHSKGEDHYHWQGGTAKHSGGYVYQNAEGHPCCGKNGYVFQHRLVVEQKMLSEFPQHHFLIEMDGQKVLSPEIDVHHLNEVKDDNREENLVACTAAAHHAFHHGLKIGTDEYWPHDTKPNSKKGARLSRVCATCYKEFFVIRSHVKNGRGIYCSRACLLNRSQIKPDT